MVFRRIGEFLPRRADRLNVLLGIAGLVGLYALSRHNFLLFHCLVEAFSIGVAIAVFAIFWNTRRFLDSGAYLVIALACPFACALDLIYMLAYEGMSVFPGADGNTALQAKTAANWFVSLSCVCAFPFLRSKINPNAVLCVYGSLLAVALGTIFVWPVFPDCYVPGVGITAFERIGLVISCSAYLGGAVWLAVRRREFDNYVRKLFMATLAVFFVEDLASAVAVELNGPARTVAHLCQIVAFCFIYRAFVEVGLTRPYGLLFRTQRQTAEELQSILDSVPAWIFFKDKENRFLRVNRALAKVMGVSREQLEGRSLFDIYPREQAEAFWNDDREVISSGAPKANIIEPMRATVEQRWAQTDKIPYRDAQGNIIGVIGFSLDITERRHAEEVLKQAHERQLREHQAELAHVARLSMMGEMAASLAHELNQPLHAVNNYARGAVRRLLKTPQRDEELVAVLGQISEETNRAAEIVRRVRRFVRRRELQLSEVLVNRLVEEVVLLNKPDVERRRTRVVLALANDLPPLLGDSIQIEQVIMNLLRNGLEAMEEVPEGDRVLHINSMRDGEDAIAVEVRDCGIGICQEDLERVFEPFFTTRIEGMGMGLAISRSIVQAHGGRLWATRNQTQGCTFHCTLPIGKRGSSHDQ